MNLVIFGSGTGIILCMHPANERLCYTVKPSLIDLVHTQNDPWVVAGHESNLSEFKGLKSIIFKTSNLLRGECHRTLLMTSNIDIGNDLVLSGNKALHKLMMIQIYVAIWHHYATMS